MHHAMPQNMPAKPYRFVRVSSNRKTGPIPVTSTAAQSCPQACPMRTDAQGGCYAASGNSAIHWRALSEGRASTALTLQGLTDAIASLPRGQLWRMNEAGDLAQDSSGGIDTVSLSAIIRANSAKRGFTYTHHRVTGDDAQGRNNRALVTWANERGFTVNASSNNPTHADAVADAAPGVPVVTLMDPDAWQGARANTASTPAGRAIVRCPAEYMEGMDCARCGLCAVSTRRGIVGFTAHGTGRKRVIAIVKAAA